MARTSPEQRKFQKIVNLEVNDTRMSIVDFLEKQLFRKEPIEDEVCHLTYDIWKDIKEDILKGNYQPRKES